MKIKLWMVAGLLLVGTTQVSYAQKKKAPAKKKPITTATTKPVSGVGRFNKVAQLSGNGKEITPIITNAAAITDMETFINSCIAKGAFPGCQVFAAKDGIIIYNKSFGHLDYDKKKSVTDTTLYDIASVTKILSTTLAVMKLYEEGKINLNAPISTYLPFTIGTDKANITVKSLLLHQAGFKGWIPFHKATMDSLTGLPSKDLYHRVESPGFAKPVSAGMFLKNSYPNYMVMEMIGSPLDNKGKYVYSDIDLILLEKIVNKITGQTLDRYVYDNFYIPLKLKRTYYNPWILNATANCAPTENDQTFRFQKIQGYVHDPVAALMGGVAGHAGLFSNANEVAIIMQMLNNGGVYNDKRYFKKETVQLFTGYRSTISRRGYGFDKPEKSGDGGPTANVCSKSTFGHTGFTGTCAWADPETGIVFVFLSNRVNPSSENTLITSLKVRGTVQNYIYQAVGNGK